MSWSGVKKQSYEQKIKFWCDEMDIKNYNINSKGEIDVDGSVSLSSRNIKELPFKFGKVNGYFTLAYNKNIISLKNCPNETGGYFDVDRCTKLNSLEGCPKEVGGNFYCRFCKRDFIEEDVKSLCKVSKGIYCDI